MENSKWKTVQEANDDNENPTMWSKEINHPKYGKFVWIVLDCNKCFNVEVDCDNEFRILVQCKSLASAKRWVSMHLT